MHSPKPDLCLSAATKAWLERYPDPAERRTPAALRELGFSDANDVSALDVLTAIEALDRLASGELTA